MNPKPFPYFVFDIWANGCADYQCSQYQDIGTPVSRLFWRVRGEVLMFLFGWWWWVEG